MLLLGLTGSIGMGKSTAAGFFRRNGVPVFDADLYVHQLYRGKAAPLIEAAFPGTVHGGVVNRALLAEKLRGDEAAFRRLEGLVHPLVREGRAAFIAEARAKGRRMAVLDIPLLFETGGESGVNFTVVVSAPESVQRERVLARPGMTVERLASIMARQMPDADKRRRAHFVIQTGAELDAAERQVRSLIRSLAAMDPRPISKG